MIYFPLKDYNLRGTVKLWTTDNTCSILILFLCSMNFILLCLFSRSPYSLAKNKCCLLVHAENIKLKVLVYHVTCAGLLLHISVLMLFAKNRIFKFGYCP